MFTGSMRLLNGRRIAISVATAIALISVLAAAEPATAAAFSTYVEEGDEFCSMDLQGPDQLLISVEKGRGVTGEVWLELKADRDKSFSTEYELRLEVTVGKDTPDAFLGGTEDTNNVPGFLIPLSTVGALSTAPTFTYQIEDRPAVKLNGLTDAEVKRLVDCMQKE
jgi:hypothetical protein